MAEDCLSGGDVSDNGLARREFAGDDGCDEA